MSLPEKRLPLKNFAAQSFHWFQAVLYLKIVLCAWADSNVVGSGFAASINCLEQSFPRLARFHCTVLLQSYEK